MSHIATVFVQHGAHTITVDAGHLAAFTSPDLIAEAVATGCDQIASRIVFPNRRHRFGRAFSRLFRGRRRGTRLLRR